MVVATRQHGAITVAQMRQLGITPRVIRWKSRAGAIEEVVPGVYRVGGSAQTWEQRLIAVCLWGGPDACASHKSAAALWKFDGFGPGPLEISALKQNRTQLAFKVHRTLLDPAFTTTKLGIPVTNAFRTLRDVVTVVGERRGNQLFDELLRKGLVSMASLREMVDREVGSGHRGIGVLRHLLEQRSTDYQPSASELQAAVRKLLAQAGWRFVEEFVVTDGEGNFVARVDFKLEGSPVVVEVDGRANHSSKLDWQKDLDRRNLLTAEGLAVVHATYEKVMHHPEDFLAEVARAEASYIRRRT